ncbi:hypothetical protein PLESTM_001933700 [Pleodorina starrii]|nr:hypothetical protein PLESTM_001933700 [Pleodorina starrii]
MAQQQHTGGGGEVSEPAGGGSRVGPGQIGRSQVVYAAAAGLEDEEGQQTAAVQRLVQQLHVRYRRKGPCSPPPPPLPSPALATPPAAAAAAVSAAAGARALRRMCWGPKLWNATECVKGEV